MPRIGMSEGVAVLHGRGRRTSLVQQLRERISGVRTAARAQILDRGSIPVVEIQYATV